MSLAHWNTWEDIRADLGTWAAVAVLGAAGGWFYAHHSIAKGCQRTGVFYTEDVAYQCGMRGQATESQAQIGTSPVNSRLTVRNKRHPSWIM